MNRFIALCVEWILIFVIVVAVIFVAWVLLAELIQQLVWIIF